MSPETQPTPSPQLALLLAAFAVVADCEEAVWLHWRRLSRTNRGRLAEHFGTASPFDTFLALQRSLPRRRRSTRRGGSGSGD